MWVDGVLSLQSSEGAENPARRGRKSHVSPAAGRRRRGAEIRGCQGQEGGVGGWQLGKWRGELCVLVPRGGTSRAAQGGLRDSQRWTGPREVGYRWSVGVRGGTWAWCSGIRRRRMGEGRGLSKVGSRQRSGGPAPPTSPWVPPLFRPEEFLRVPEYRCVPEFVGLGLPCWSPSGRGSRVKEAQSRCYVLRSCPVSELPCI